MKTTIPEHLLGIIFVTLLMAGTLFYFESRTTHTRLRKRAKISHLLNAPVEKINDPFERALLADCMDIFYPGVHDSNSAALEEFFRVKEEEINRTLQSSYRNKELSFGTVIELTGMYIKFLLIYIIVMLLTYYGVQTLGTLRFILKQQKLEQRVAAGVFRQFSPKSLFFAFVKTLAYMVLFSPAYVIAYSIRTEFNTDSSLFMILLGVLSNGLLVMYTNKFYAFLVAENKKGYVSNAIVKNLRSGYSFSEKHGIARSAVFKIRKQFTGHVFDHIYRNARFQYLSTIKEQASFLITGLVIIEMALNIHGHLTYELLRQLLYRNYTLVIAIMLLIFYTVKFTEIVTDLLVSRESKRYENN